MTALRPARPVSPWRIVVQEVREHTCPGWLNMHTDNPVDLYRQYKERLRRDTLMTIGRARALTRLFPFSSVELWLELARAYQEGKDG